MVELFFFFCNTQEGLLSFAQTGDSHLLGGRAHRTANWASFICSMLHTGYKVIGYMFAKQSYWYKLRGLLFKFKAILLVQTARAFFKLRRPRAFYWVHIDWPAPGHPRGAGNRWWNLSFTFMIIMGSLNRLSLPSYRVQLA